MKNKIEIIHGDITKIAADIIVNAANTSLLGGSGVDGAIHRAGGSKILQECQKIRMAKGGCKVGNAVITPAGKLPAKYVIHTVGPKWNGGYNHEEILLRNCYINCLELAIKYEATTISFPNISTGIYQFPKNKAASIALEIIRKKLSENLSIEKIYIVCFEKDNYDIYKELMKKI